MRAGSLRSSVHCAARAGWLILPVVAAGLGHVLILKTRVLERMAVPLDGGLALAGQPLFGSNKTWRGILVMTSLTAAATRVQVALARHVRGGVLNLPLRYRANAWAAGGAIGLAYCLAELPNSFVKRRLGVQAGARGRRAPRLQYLVDQLDSIAGCLVVIRLVFRPRRGELPAALFLGACVHIGVDVLMYAIGVKGRER